MEPEPPPSPRSAYRLVWDVHRKVLSTYACVVECGLGPSGNAMPPHDDDANQLSELDLFALDRVGRDLSALRRSGKRALISAPVHFETLANKRHRKRFFKILEGFPAPLTRDLLFGLRGFSAGVPSGRLLELTVPLARLCRSLILQVDLDHRSFRSLRETGIRVVNVDFAGRNDSESDVIEAMNDFAQRASQEDMILVGGGLASRSMVIGALGAGFAYVEGSAIHQHVASPEQVVRFNIVDLFAQYVGSAAASPRGG